MRWREFIKVIAVASAAAWPLAAHAQQRDRMRRIGVLMALAADDPAGQARFVAFVQTLQELGWTDGRNVRPIRSTHSGARPATSIVFSRARSQPICRCRRRPSTNW